MEPELVEFLRKNDCEDAVEKMEQEKITLKTIREMNEKDLAPFIDKVGDRISIKLFAEEELKKSTCSDKSDKRKSTILQSLKSKLGIINSKTEHSSSEEDELRYNVRQGTRMARRGNANAKRENRKLELGWIHKGKQVRAVRGGGTRKLTMKKSATKEDVLKEAKLLFFPDGTSQIGPSENFSYRLKDFSGRNVDKETIEELYDKCKINSLRVYMVTEVQPGLEVQPKENPDIQEAVKVKEIEQCESFSDQNYLPKLDNEKPSTPETLNDILDLEQVHQPSTSQTFDNILDVQVIHVEQPSTSQTLYNISDMQKVEQTTLSDMRCVTGNYCYDPEVMFGPNQIGSSADLLNDTVPLSETVKSIIVKRGMVFEDTLNYFMTHDFDSRKDILEVEILSERGEDSGGVFRDVLSEFWETFQLKHTVGSDIKIPTTAHIMKEEEWHAVAKMLICGFRQEKYLPISLSEVFLQRCIDGLEVPDDRLLETFIGSLPPVDKEVVNTALNDFDNVDMDDLWDLCSTYEARVAPRKDNITKLIRDIAHHQIIQKASFVTECWAPLLQRELKPLLTDDGLKEIYRSLQVTTRKVLNMLVFPNDVSKGDKITLDALRQYVRSCPQEKLKAFLRFCTGSDLITGKKITVTITEPMPPFSMRPIAHTCGCILKLSSSYDNFLLLREHFDLVLDSKMLRMDMI